MVMTLLFDPDFIILVRFHRFFQLVPIATVHSEIVDFVTIPPSMYGSSAANFSAASFVVKTNSAVNVHMMCNYL